jgi:hypothetical protein
MKAGPDQPIILELGRLSVQLIIQQYTAGYVSYVSEGIIIKQNS